MGSFLPFPGGGLPGLPGLPGIELPGFLPNPTGPGKNDPNHPGLVIGCTSGYCLPGGGNVGGVDVDLGGGVGKITITDPTTIKALGTVGATGSAVAGAIGSTVWNIFGTRFAFFILGLILIIAGLYLLKETRFLVTVPLRAGKEAAVTTAKIAGAAAKGAAGGEGG